MNMRLQRPLVVYFATCMVGLLIGRRGLALPGAYVTNVKRLLAKSF